MTVRRVLMIGLDGFDPVVADKFIAEGKLPAFKQLREDSAWFSLDHGASRRTGLAWEHVASGLNPDAAGKWSAVDFDPKTYRAVQRNTLQSPFTAAMADKKVVVFDPPYFNLAKDPKVAGVVGWGAHDPGVAEQSRPQDLLGEIREKFGRYSAPEWIYANVWNSVAASNAMANEVVRATAQRASLIEWFLRERCPEWDLGFVVFSEFHSALEAMWHGLDPTHPLHGLASAGAARRCVEGVYDVVDGFLARARTMFPDTHLVAFNLHGMGANDADIPSMVLLPELMFRYAFGQPLMRTRAWRITKDGIPLLDENETWDRSIEDLYTNRISQWAGRLTRKLKRTVFPGGALADGENSLAWMPAMKYQPYWADMQAFALPSYYDAQIRVNLKGREGQGRVALSEYDAVCADIEALLLAVKNPLTGEPAVASVERTRKPPLTLRESEADFVVTWRPVTLGLTHPTLGDVGPLPYRRTGGHTGGHGAAYITGAGRPGFGGVRSAFDVVPTIFQLMGVEPPAGLSGQSLLPVEA
jgi:predicted AlkP superfamily phosphohydrolase/phosphomutase